MSIATNILKIKNELPAGVKLVAVSKTRSVSEIMEAYSTGHKIFGENRVQELIEKQKMLPRDIEWHMIGRLQTNKVKYIAPFINFIHSVDSLRLLQAINKEAEKNSRITNCLLQIKISKEETKQGLNYNTAEKIIKESEYRAMKYINIAGLMGMASFTEDKNRIRGEFKYLKSCFEILKERYLKDENNFRELSMGMSGDYKIAIDEGSTIIRVGTNIFGRRD